VACLGFDSESDLRPIEHDANQFGFAAREWNAFSSGAQVLADIGQDEIRVRLRARKPALPEGRSAAECAECLLLHEQGLTTAAALVSAVGGSSGARLLEDRLSALGLPSGGTVLEKARRLLMLRTVSVRGMIWAAATGFPASIAAAFNSLPAGQADAVHSEDVCPAEYEDVETAIELPGRRWQHANQTFCVKHPSQIGSRAPQREENRNLIQLRQPTYPRSALRRNQRRRRLRTKVLQSEYDKRFEGLL
jgi:hypothetical protein